MKHPKISATFFLLLIWIFNLSGHAEGQTISLDVTNKCPFPIWPATAPNEGQPVIAAGGFFLASGKMRCIQAPPDWNGRLWARTGCYFTDGSRPACQTGDCEGRLDCSGSIGLPPVTLVQVSFQSGNPSFYDVSVVDGYNLPVSVSAKSSASNCFIPGCSKNLKSSCPAELQVLNDTGNVVACKSACLAFNLDTYCCRNAYESQDRCKPSKYSRMFKDACPSYSSYAFDRQALVSCTSKEYVITFCPSKWGDHMPI